MNRAGVPKLADNHILGNLPSDEQKIIASDLDLITVQSKQEIYPLASPLNYLHFPINSAFSLMDHRSSGQTVELAVIGKEGCTGFNTMQGLKTSPCRMIAQLGGLTYRLSASLVDDSVPVLRSSLVRFSALMFREAVLSVGCSQFHSVEQRLGRWLLVHEHRTGLRRYPFTHDFVAEQLGVQRATVSEALSLFQKKKMINYGYGEIELLDIKAMGKVSCECFVLAKQAVDEFLQEIKNYKRR